MDYDIDFHKHFAWLKTVNPRTPASKDTYLERLSRLEGDKESLLLQVSVLTDQVEAQGVKISDLESSLEEHQIKLNSTEEMLQQELHRRASLESQKQKLLGQVSHLTLHLTSMEDRQALGADRQLTSMEDRQALGADRQLTSMEDRQAVGAERQHKAESVVNLISELQEQMCRIQQELQVRIKENQELQEASSPDQGLGWDTSPEEVHVNGLQEAPDRPDSWSGQGQGSSEEQCCCGGERVLYEELRTLKEKVEVLEEQKHLYERRLKTTKAQILDLQQVLLSKNAEIDSLHSQLLSRPSLVTEGWEREEMYRRRLNNKHQELQRLRVGMESLLAANDEKDRRIEELTLLLSQCRQFREISATRHGNHAPSPASPPALPVSNQRTPSSSSEEEEQGAMTTAQSTDSPSSSLKSESQLSSSSSSPQLRSSISSHPRPRPLPLLLSSSMNDLQNGSSQKAQEQQGEGKCSTLPVKVSHTEHNGDIEAGDTSEARETSDSPEAGEAGEAGGASEASDCQSQRSPALSENEDSSLKGKSEKTGSVPPSDSSPQSSGAESGQRLVGSPEHLKNNRSIRKLWGKLRRTQSGGLQSGGLQTGGLHPVDQDQSQFRRGGLRATAGPRLTRSPGSASAVRDVNTPFRQWSREQVCGWLEDCGLGQYVNLTRQWVESGQTLLSATAQDFEKEMGMKHALHRKKLQLALSSISSRVVDKSSDLDHIWVTRWLDDIGLPQYKDQFHEGRVDGRMIQYLTVNDLLALKVTSQLHHLSIKCAIHVLHVNKFNPHCLRRRPGEEKQPPPSEVVQWSNHRVMEWLRAVELAEYAPNLRGSGVHGGLIILEPRFSSETLALLLNIPPQKTLLRRHLASAFSALVGPQASLEKREYANATGHVPLTTTAKVRPKKLGFHHFGHLRKRRPDEMEDYICPIGTGALAVSNGVSPRPYAGVRGLSPILDRDTDARQEQVETKT